MDRYLFRGKAVLQGIGESELSKRENEWIVGYLRKSRSRFAQNIESMLIQPMERLWESFIVDSATVGQCTRLKDRNDTLIFEGDVLRVWENYDKFHPDTGKSCVVRFGENKNITGETHFPNGSVGFYLEWQGFTNNGLKLSTVLRNDILYWVGNNFVEIIGNIHDTPSLLNT